MPITIVMQRESWIFLAQISRNVFTYPYKLLNMSKSQIQNRRGISGTLGTFWNPGSKPKNQKMCLGMTKNVDIIGIPKIFFAQILGNVS